MILLYGVMFLEMRGHLTFFSKKKQRQSAFALDTDEDQIRRLKAIANSLLLYVHPCLLRSFHRDNSNTFIKLSSRLRRMHFPQLSLQMARIQRK